MTILALADHRPRGPFGSHRPRERQAAPPPVPPAMQVRPPQWPLFAIPGKAEARNRVEAVIGSMTQKPALLRPGHVAVWVTCLVCEARWKGQFSSDGRPAYEGGLIDAHARLDQQRRHVVAVACRCPAGLASGAPVATERQFRAAVRWRQQRQLRGLSQLEDGTLLDYLVNTRTEIYRRNWEYRVQQICQAGSDTSAAWRRAVIVCDWQWQGRTHP